MFFVDLKAAYDTVNREALLMVLMFEYNVSKKLCNIIRALYTGTKAAVRIEGELTEWFKIVNGLRQGCLLSPMLFNVYIDHVVRLSTAGMDAGITIKYNMPDGRIHLGMNVSGEERIMALLYADDLVLIWEEEASLSQLY